MDNGGCRPVEVAGGDLRLASVPVTAVIGAPPTTEVVMSTTVETANEIRPFQVDIPDEALDDLRRASPRRAGPARSSSKTEPRACS